MAGKESRMRRSRVLSNIRELEELYSETYKINKQVISRVEKNNKELHKI